MILEATTKKKNLQRTHVYTDIFVVLVHRTHPSSGGVFQKHPVYEPTGRAVDWAALGYVTNRIRIPDPPGNRRQVVLSEISRLRTGLKWFARIKLLRISQHKSGPQSR